MTAKKNQKSGRQKKVLKIASEIRVKDMGNVEAQKVRNDEDALRRQLLLIQKDYRRLMTDVATGYTLIRHWVGIQASTGGELLRTRFIKN